MTITAIIGTIIFWTGLVTTLVILHGAKKVDAGGAILLASLTLSGVILLAA